MFQLQQPRPGGCRGLFTFFAFFTNTSSAKRAADDYGTKTTTS
jgi:hypothetical protein